MKILLKLPAGVAEVPGAGFKDAQAASLTLLPDDGEYPLGNTMHFCLIAQLWLADARTEAAIEGVGHVYDLRVDTPDGPLVGVTKHVRVTGHCN